MEYHGKGRFLFARSFFNFVNVVFVFYVRNVHLSIRKYCVYVFATYLCIKYCPKITRIS